MNETTYILGAGASCNSMPLVKNFSARFEFFIDFVVSITVGVRNAFVQDCKDFLEKVESHSSFDTYFKKLFHQNNDTDIKKGKAILFIYFLFEHYYKIDKQGEIDERVKDKKSISDHRYEALIAGLLKPIKGESEFFGKVNFITWNYDLNLFYSIRNFFFPRADLTKVISEFQERINTFKVDDQIEIIHMNGFISDPNANDIMGLDIDMLKTILSEKISLYSRERERLIQLASTIKFAWESLNTFTDNNFPPFVKIAKECVKRSSNIIVIGYSFPLYNRLIDLQILNPVSLASKRLTIQDVQPEVIKEVLINDFSISPREQFVGDHNYTTDIQTTSAINSFFVPNNIFVPKNQALQDLRPE